MTTTTFALLPIPDKLFFNRREIVSLTVLHLPFVDSSIADETIRVKRVGDRVLIPRHELLQFTELGKTISGKR